METSFVAAAMTAAIACMLEWVVFRLLPMPRQNLKTPVGENRTKECMAGIGRRGASRSLVRRRRGGFLLLVYVSLKPEKLSGRKQDKRVRGLLEQ